MTILSEPLLNDTSMTVTEQSTSDIKPSDLGPAHQESEKEQVIQNIEFYRAILGETPPKWQIRLALLLFPPPDASQSNSQTSNRTRSQYAQNGATEVTMTGSFRIFAGLWYLCLRASMLTVIVLLLYGGIKRYVEGHISPLIAFTVLLPILLSTCAALWLTWSFLPSEFAILAATVMEANDGDSLVIDSKVVNKAGKVSVRACTLQILTSIIVYTIFIRRQNSDKADPEASSAKGESLIFLTIYSSTPTVGAILFLLSLDVERARLVIRLLRNKVKNLEIDISEYRKAYRKINGISERWQGPLTVLAILAIYNFIGLLIFVKWHEHKVEELVDDQDDLNADDYSLGDEWNFEILFASIMAKESVLFLCFAFRARIVNDEADDLLTEYYHYNPLKVREEEKKEEYSDISGVTTDLQPSNSEINLLKMQIAELMEFKKKTEVLMEGMQMSFLSSKDDRNRRGKGCTGFLKRISANNSTRIEFTVLGVRWSTSVSAQILVYICSYSSCDNTCACFCVSESVLHYFDGSMVDINIVNSH